MKSTMALVLPLAAFSACTTTTKGEGPGGSTSSSSTSSSGSSSGPSSSGFSGGSTTSSSSGNLGSNCTENFDCTGFAQCSCNDGYKAPAPNTCQFEICAPDCEFTCKNHGGF